MQVMYQLIF